MKLTLLFIERLKYRAKQNILTAVPLAAKDSKELYNLIYK